MTTPPRPAFIVNADDVDEQPGAYPGSSEQLIKGASTLDVFPVTRWRG